MAEYRFTDVTRRKDYEGTWSWEEYLSIVSVDSQLTSVILIVSLMHGVYQSQNLQSAVTAKRLKERINSN